MRLFAALLVLSIHLTLLSSNEPKYNGFYYDRLFFDNARCNEQYKALKVKKIKVLYIDKKGKSSAQFSIYDEDGYLVSTESFNDKNERTFFYRQELSASKNLVYAISESNNLKMVNKYFYNDKQKRTRHETWRNDRLSYFRIWVYNAKGQLVEHSSHKEKGIINKSTYLYNENDNLAKVIYYNSKGKITRVYNYECRDEGEKVSLTKQENLVCKHYARENNTLIAIDETTDSKGQISRVVRKYRDIDTLLLEENYFSSKGLLYLKLTYFEKKDKLKSRENFNTKGLALYASHYQYDQNWNRISEKSTRKGKLILEINWTFDESGMCIKSSTVNNKKSLVYSAVYEILEKH